MFRAVDMLESRAWLRCRLDCLRTWHAEIPNASISFCVSTLTYQNLLFCRFPINSILGCILRTYEKVGYGRLW